MTVQFHLPDLGEGITEAEVVRWLVKAGDTIAQDQEVVAVQTDKAVVELPSPVAGTVLALNVAEGQVIPVETVLLTIGEEDQLAATPVKTVHSPMVQENQPVTHHDATSRTKQRVLATPVARKMARDMGIDLATLHGSGPAGRIRTEDVQRVASLKSTNGVGTASSRPGNPTDKVNMDTIHRSLPQSGNDTQDEERIPLRGLRRRIAENMVRSVSTIPQVTSQVEVDATGLMMLRSALQTEADTEGVKLSYLPLIIKVLVQTLQLYPYINATIDDERQEIVLKHTYHIGIATATPDGLLVPVIRHANRLTILEIASELNRLAEAGRERKLQLDELRGSTFTISNYGSVGGFFTTPIINPGEAGILGLGRIVKRPWVVEDRVEVRPILPLSFTADHRLIDGELAMRFLNTLVSLLENPQRLLLRMH